MTTRTATEKKAESKAQYDAFLAGCPSRQLLDRISDKWATLILCALADQREAGGADRVRYSELARRIAGVSQKMLTQTLRSLERDGLVTRSVAATVPVTVTYAMTPLGRSLHQSVRLLKEWAETNMDEVFANRDVHDGRAS